MVLLLRVLLLLGALLLLDRLQGECVPHVAHALASEGLPQRARSLRVHGGGEQGAVERDLHLFGEVELDLSRIRAFGREVVAARQQKAVDAPDELLRGGASLQR